VALPVRPPPVHEAVDGDGGPECHEAVGGRDCREHGVGAESELEFEHGHEHCMINQLGWDYLCKRRKSIGRGIAFLYILPSPAPRALVRYMLIPKRDLA
jgi:hypothetical protein